MSKSASGALESNLNEARRMMSDGRALEAIDRLSELYHDRADPRVAQLLVEARNAAFGELPKTAGRPEWPAAFTDPFPGATGIVEVTPDALHGDVLGGALTHHGCLRVNGLLDAPTAARLRDRIEDAFQARARVEGGASVESVAPSYVPYAPGQGKAKGFGGELFIRVVDSPATLCDLVDVFTATGIRDVVTEYLAERPAAIANKWILRRSPSGVVLGDFHQDGAFLGDGIRTVDCWIALSDCGPGTGRPAIDLLPVRMDRVLPTGEDSTFSWSLAEDAVHEARPDLAVASPVFAPGDALFFDELLVHRTSVGADLETRYAIESWFVAPSSYPAKHLPVVL